MTGSRLSIICIAFVQILALVLWGFAAVQARPGVMTGTPLVVVGGALAAVGAGQACPRMTDDDCPRGCCHGSHCDDVIGCLGVAGGSLVIATPSSIATIVGLNEVVRFPPVQQVPAGLSIPPPSRPPNG